MDCVCDRIELIITYVDTDEITEYFIQDYHEYQDKNIHDYIMNILSEKLNNKVINPHVIFKNDKVFIKFSTSTHSNCTIYEYSNSRCHDYWVLEMDNLDDEVD